MRQIECPFEPEVLRTVVEGRWPESCSAELREHVSVCPDCADLVRVATSVSEDRGSVVRAACPPSAGLVWWKMQLRRRRENELALQRTTLALQAAVVVVALGAALALLRFATIPSTGWLWSSLRDAFHVSTSIFVVTLVLLALAPVATWLTFGHD